MRLGRLPANHADIARAPSLRDHHFAAMPPPQRLDRRDIDFQPRMFGNNIYPDCSAAGLANGMLAVSALDGLTPVIADAMVPAFYAECVDVPNTPDAIAATDGAVLLDVLRHQAAQGFSVGQQVSVAGLFGSVAHSRTALAQTMAALGFAYIGVNLYDRDMQTSGTWDDDGSPRGDAVGGHCFSGDTKISLLDGREISIKDFPLGQSLWVYSCAPDGTIVPGLAKSLGVTKRNSETVVVELDNGEKITCTPDHRFMLRNGTYLEASKLSCGQSLMPLYRKIYKGGYEMCLIPKSHKWSLTHRLSAGTSGTKRKNSIVVHHKDFNKRNNSPDNLQIMTWNDHTELHSKNTVLLKNYAKSSVGREKSRSLMAALWADPEWAERQKDRLKKSASSRSKNMIAFQKARAREKIVDLRTREEKLEAKKNSDIKKLSKFRENNTHPCIGTVWINDGIRRARRVNPDEQIPDGWQFGRVINHKVVSVTSGLPQDVYDLSVLGWHNFALSSGVFVHNCVCLWDYLGLADTDTARIATWGQLRPVTWRWIDATLDESWGLFWRQLTPERMTVEDDDRLAAMVRGMAA